MTFQPRQVGAALLAGGPILKEFAASKWLWYFGIVLFLVGCICMGFSSRTKIKIGQRKK